MALFWTTGGLALLGPVVEAADALSRSRANRVVGCVPWLSIGFGAIKHTPFVSSMSNHLLGYTGTLET